MWRKPKKKWGKARRIWASMGNSHSWNPLQSPYLLILFHPSSRPLWSSIIIHYLVSYLPPLHFWYPSTIAVLPNTDEGHSFTSTYRARTWWHDHKRTSDSGEQDMLEVLYLLKWKTFPWKHILIKHKCLIVIIITKNISQ